MEINEKIPFLIKFELGSTKKKVKEILNVTKGTLYRLEKSEKDIVDIKIGSESIGKGKILVRDGKMFVEIVALSKE